MSSQTFGEDLCLPGRHAMTIGIAGIWASVT